MLQYYIYLEVMKVCELPRRDAGNRTRNVYNGFADRRRENHSTRTARLSNEDLLSVDEVYDSTYLVRPQAL